MREERLRSKSLKRRARLLMVGIDAAERPEEIRNAMKYVSTGRKRAGSR